MNDSVNHPKHYTQHPSRVECIQITEHMNFCLGNAIKYIWRADMKGGIEDLEKAQWYINREIQRRKHENSKPKEHPVADTTLSGVYIAPGSIQGWQSRAIEKP